MIKKNVFTILAFVIAIGAVAFTKPKKQTDMYVFEFDGTQSGGYSIGNVENESNTYWKYVGKNESLCGGSTKACRVSVTGSYVNSTSNPTALSGVTITATESSSGVAYASGITNSPTNIISNQP